MAPSTEKPDSQPPRDPQVRFDELASRHLEAIHGFARGCIGKRLRREVDTAEVVQGALLRWVEAYHEDAGIASMDDAAFLAWIKRVIKSRVIPDLVRRGKALKRQGDRTTQLDTKVARELVDRRVPSPSEELKRAETRAKLESLMQGLTPRERQVVTLSCLEEKTNAEVASMLGISEESVQVSKSRGLRKLR